MDCRNGELLITPKKDTINNIKYFQVQDVQYMNLSPSVATVQRLGPPVREAACA